MVPLPNNTDSHILPENMHRQEQSTLLLLLVPSCSGGVQTDTALVLGSLLHPFAISEGQLYSAPVARAGFIRPAITALKVFLFDKINRFFQRLSVPRHFGLGCGEACFVTRLISPTCVAHRFFDGYGL